MIRKVHLARQLAHRNDRCTAQHHRRVRALEETDQHREHQVHVLLQVRAKHIEGLQHAQKRRRAFRCNFAFERLQQIRQQQRQVRLELALEGPCNCLHQRDNRELDRRIRVPVRLHERKNIA